MNITAVIAEYNPLHNGHVQHLEAARKDTDADHVIAVMSGDYVQRGVPAIVSKYERSRSVLMSGADLVLALPLYYSTGSLEYFANGAVSLIAKTGITGCISFGSECGNISKLTEAASLLDDLLSDHGNNTSVNSMIAGGVNYASAINSLPGLNVNMRNLLKTPNNLLAVAYIRAAHKLMPGVSFHTVKRFGSGHNDASKGALSSTAIRNELLSSCNMMTETSSPDIRALSDRIPDESFYILSDYLKKYPPLCENDLSLILFRKLQELTDNGRETERLMQYLDVSSNIAAKIAKTFKQASSYSDLIGLIKSKDIAYSRISRALLHILLDIRTDNMKEYVSDGYNYYLRILGFRQKADRLLHCLKQNTSVPMITKCADAASVLKRYYMSDNRDTFDKDENSRVLSHALRMFSEDIEASELYNKAACMKYSQPFISEYEQQMIII